ncbi:hypothetical protein LEP1GSC086_1257 [Leptospira weilii str. LNT 1234]|nr:hypothetical protein LEP1GSC086_1257 [Leptospira weilii str. LNT 1234]
MVSEKRFLTKKTDAPNGFEMKKQGRYSFGNRFKNENPKIFFRNL